LDELTAPLENALRAMPVPLLVLRVDGEQSCALAAFSQACAQVVRSTDLAAQDPATKRFVVAMLSAGRERQQLTAADCANVVQRLGAMVSLNACAPVETGWTMLHRIDGAAGVRMQVQAALARGVRERERYDFFAAIGHELRTPLTSIRGYLETLLDGSVEGVTARRFLETARRETLRMSRLVDGMFAFSLLDLSSSALGERGCRVRAQVTLACDILTPLAQQRDITISAAGEDATAYIESDACLQLLVNLIENAIKYGRPGGRVDVTIRRHTDTVEVLVDDDGPGVAACERRSIFELRVRGEGALHKPGAGIGLAMVKTITERDGGSVTVEDSPLGGARFAVVLRRWAESASCAS
jgi:signal transduction histidine kinase